MSNLADGIIAERRLALLQLLVQDGGRGNDRSLTTAMRMMGHTQYLDLEHVRQMLRELAERGCVAARMERDIMLVVDITERGRMAVAGHISIAGIASPNLGF